MNNGRKYDAHGLGWLPVSWLIVIDRSSCLGFLLLEAHLEFHNSVWIISLSPGEVPDGRCERAPPRFRVYWPASPGQSEPLNRVCC